MIERSKREKSSNEKQIFHPNKKSHKGDNGRVLIIAGSKKYHGSALLSIRAAIPFVDIVYYYLPDKDPFLMQSVKMIPEVIVIQNYRDVLRLVKNKKIDSVLIGPGLGNCINKINIDDFKTINRVIDADGLRVINKHNLNKNTVLTPHHGEFERTFGVKLTDKKVKDYVKRMAKEYNTNILLKGPTDYISNGSIVKENKFGNPGMTKGGTGDALAGFITALSSKNNVFLSAKLGVKLFCKTADEIYTNEKRRYYYTTSEIIEKLPEIVAKSKEIEHN